ncbi:MAG: hypothetical protein ACRDTT_19340 [Pseudonocardiaceae bacterium]
MPTVNNPTLTLTTVNDKVTIRVTYTASFKTFERQLVDLGMTYDSHVTVHPIDNGTDVGNSIVTLQEPIPVTVGNGDQDIVVVQSSLPIDRSELQEDPGLGNDDEWQAKIRIHAQQWLADPFTADVFTATQVLTG